MNQFLRENRLVEQFLLIRVDEVPATPAHQDAVGVRIRLDGRDGLGKPLEVEVQGNRTDVSAVLGREWLAIGYQHLRLQGRIIVHVPVAVRFGPARLVQQFGLHVQG